MKTTLEVNTNETILSTNGLTLKINLDNDAASIQVVKRVAKRLGCVYTEQAALDKLCIDRDEAMKEWFVANMTPAGHTLPQLW